MIKVLQTSAFPLGYSRKTKKDRLSDLAYVLSNLPAIAAPSHEILVSVAN